MRWFLAALLLLCMLAAGVAEPGNGSADSLTALAGSSGSGGDVPAESRAGQAAPGAQLPAHEQAAANDTGNASAGTAVNGTQRPRCRGEGNPSGSPAPGVEQPAGEAQPTEAPVAAQTDDSSEAGAAPGATEPTAGSTEPAAPEPQQLSPEQQQKPPEQQPPEQQQQKPEQPVAQPAVPEPPHEAAAMEEEELRNFALTKDGAKVVQANKEAKKLSALLDADSDTYVKNDCKADKWFVIELSQVAKINRVELWQHELYSSRIKSFEVRGRQSHPRVDGVELSKGLNSTQWKLLGALTAENKKGSQRFNLDNPMWARYLLLQIQSHYGSEPMCAINGFAAYGKSAAEEFEDHLASEETLQYLQNALEDEPVPPHPAPTPEPKAEPAVPVTAPAAAAPATAAAAGAGGAAAAAEDKPSGAEVGAVNEQNATSQQPAAGATEAPAAGGSDSTIAVPGDAAPAPAAAAAADSQQACSGEACSCSGDAGGPVCTAPPQGEQAQAASGSAVPAGLAPVAGTPAAEEQPAASADASKAAGAEKPAGGSVAAGETAAPPSAPAAAPEPGAAATEDRAAAGGAAAQRTDAEVATAAGTEDAEIPAKPAADNTTGTAMAGSADAAEAQAAASGQPAAQQQQQQQQQQAGQQAAPVRQQGQAQPQAHQQQPPAAAGDSGEDLPSVLSWAPKAKAGASVYDILLQEIKTTKVQQKLASKSIADLQRNLTSHYAELAADSVALAAQLAKVQAEVNQSEEALLSRVEALVDSRLQQLSQAVAALQAASEASARREAALVCLLSVLGAGVLASVPSRALGAGWLRWAVALLALGNAAVGLLLQLRGSLLPAAVLHALPHSN